MSLNKKQKIDWCDNVINQIDITSENLLLNYVNNEKLKTKINQLREEMIAEVKEIEQFNLSNHQQKFVYFVQFRCNSFDEFEYKYREENILGNLVVLNQDLSHLIKKFRHEYFPNIGKIKNSNFKDNVQSNILSSLIDKKIDKNLIVDLSNPLQNILESITITPEKNENHDYLSGLLNVDKVRNVSLDLDEFKTFSDEFLRIFNNLETLELYDLDKIEHNWSLKNLKHLRLMDAKQVFHVTKQKRRPTIKKYPFYGLMKLEKLDISQNNIREIYKDIFNGLENLVTLDLTENNLKSINKDTFVHLKNLQNLLLSDNPIEKLETGCFNGLVNLKRLKIKNYPGRSIYQDKELFIEKDVFDSCQSLEAINLSNTKVNQLDKLKLKHAKKMKVLSLLGHDVNTIFNFINQFKNLQFLSIYINKIDQNLDSICLNNLKSMLLDCCEFPKLGENFKHINSLNILVKKKTVFDLNFFEQCENLQYLSLIFFEFESVKKLSVKHLEKLKYLRYLKIQVSDCSAKYLNELNEVFEELKEYFKQLTNRLYSGYKINNGSYCINNVAYNYDSYLEINFCHPIEAYLEEYLNISSQNVDFMLSEFKLREF